jgi:c-di-GMP-binding flagellar brake protein YcgR
VSNVIFMDDRFAKASSRSTAIRDRRYAIRYPFAADVEILDLEAGSRSDGVTSDLSLGGCFVCTSRPLSLNARIRITLKRKDQAVEALAVVRIVKPRIGMGVEFLDLDAPHQQTLSRWLDQLRRSR